MARKKPSELVYPAHGLHEGIGVDKLPPLTTTLAKNCRTYDVIEERARGGRRAGLSKWLSSQVNGSTAIQAMLKVVRPKAYEPVTDSQILVTPVDSVDTAKQTVREPDGSTVVLEYDHGESAIDAARDAFGDYYFLGVESTTWEGNDGTAATLIKTDGSGTPSWHFNTKTAACVVYNPVRHQVVVAGSSTDGWEGANGAFKTCWCFDADTGELLWTFNHVATIHGLGVDTYGQYYMTGGLSDTWEGANGLPASVWKHDPFTGSVLCFFSTGSDAKDLTVNSDNEILVGQRVRSEWWTGTTGEERNCFILDTTLTAVATYDLYSLGEGDEVSGYRCDLQPNNGNLLISIGAGVGLPHPIYVVDRSGAEVWTWDAGSRDDIAGPVPFVRWDVEGHVWVGNILTDNWEGATGLSNFFKLDGSTGAVLYNENMVALEVRRVRADARVIQNSLSTREASLIVVADGTVKKILGGGLSTPTNGSDALTDKPYRIQMVEAFSKVFMVDGSHSLYYDLDANEVKDWASAVTAGTLQANARLMARYRGRVVLSGVRTDPHNWFMSKVGDPFDWDYSPSTVTAIQAVAGNASEVGVVGDIVTALIPFSDDALLIGGDHTIWQMSGDPAAGGSIDLISDKTGIAWGRAWAKNPNDILYFMGIDGIYMMAIGGKPESLTEGRLNKRFKAIDLANTRVLLEWDFLRKGLWVVAADVSGSSIQTVMFWDKRTDSWTVDEYAGSIGPSVVYGYDSELPEDNQMLFGCKDGYIRQIDTSVDDDDGDAISSVVRYQPFPLGNGYTEGMLADLSVLLAENSGPVVLKVYVGQTAEQVTEVTTPRFKRTLAAGANAITTQRVRGAWAQVELSQSLSGAPWAVESVYARVEDSGLRGRLRG